MVRPAGVRLSSVPLLAVPQDGALTGINASLGMFLDAGHIVAVMTNLDEAWGPVDMRIAEVLGRVE